MNTAERIRELIGVLDGDDHDAAEEACYQLQHDFGAAPLEPLLAAAPGFSRFGQLSAIEVFDAIADARAGPVLTSWLVDADDTVRDWAAGALGRLGVAEAVPALLAAWQASKARGTPPDWTEPMSIRAALARLGGRTVVLPSVASRLARSEASFSRCWAAADLETVLADLAGAGQVVLLFQYWGRRGPDPERRYWLPDTAYSIDLDLSRPWAELVRNGRDQAIEHARLIHAPAETVATIDWIDQSDL
jgi:hypothetical protein